MTGHLTTTAVCLLSEVSVLVGHKTINLLVYKEALALAVLLMAGKEAGEAVVAMAASGVVGATVTRHLLVLKHTLRSTL